MRQDKISSRELRKPDFSMRSNSGRMYAEKMISTQSKYAHTLLIVRAKALIGVISLAFVFVAEVVRSIHRYGAITVLTGSFVVLNAALQFTAAIYFAMARDQNLAASVLKLLMIITGIQLFIGLPAYGSLLLTLLSLATQYYAYTQVASLKDTF